MLSNPIILLEKSWRTYTVFWREWAHYILLFFIPPFLVLLVQVADLWIGVARPDLVLITSITIICLFVVSLFVGLLTSIAMTKAMASVIAERPLLPWREAFRGALPLFWPAAYTSCLAALIIFGGTLLFVIPGLIFFAWYAFSLYAVVLRGQRGLGALQYSKALVVGRWWQIAVRVVVPLAIIAVSAFLLFKLVRLPLYLATSHQIIFVFVSTVLWYLMQALVAPLTALVLVHLFVEAEEK